MYLFIYFIAHLSIYLFIHLSIYLDICPFIFYILLIHVFNYFINYFFINDKERPLVTYLLDF